MANVRCRQCGAPVDRLSEKKRCDYCGAPFSEASAQQGSGTGTPRRGLVIALAVGILLTVLGLAAVMFWTTSEPAPPAPVIARAADLAVAPVPDPVRAVQRLPDATPSLPSDARMLTLHDRVREHFLAEGARLCLEGNLAHFGPFAGAVHLTCHPQGQVTGLRVEMQPTAPQVVRCLRQKLGQGPVYEGGLMDLVLHFSGGRSADGLQYRQGIELHDRSPQGAGTPSPAERNP